MNYVVSLVVLAILLIVSAPSASAHVLITDDTKELGAVLHIIPDDDPVAGESATVFFDLQDRTKKLENASVTMSVISSKGRSTDIAMDVDGSLATAAYTFPQQGQYRLVVTIVSSSERYVFTHVQRVSRGTAEEEMETQRDVGAEAVLIGSFVLMAVGSIIAWNRRNAIRKTSRFKVK